jgi:hypothetical protein
MTDDRDAAWGVSGQGAGLAGLGLDDWFARLPWWFVLELPEWAWEEV